MLKVKLLDLKAKLPTVANSGDLAYDLYALEDTVLYPMRVTKVRTGVAAQASQVTTTTQSTPLGLLLRDRSSMAAKGITVTGGVIDPGYTGEITVVMTYYVDSNTENYYIIHEGDRIAQMIPIQCLTGAVVEVDELDNSERGDKGFGSSGK